MGVEHWFEVVAAVANILSEYNVFIPGLKMTLLCGLCLFSAVHGAKVFCYLGPFQELVLFPMLLMVLPQMIFFSSNEIALESTFDYWEELTRKE